MPNTSGWTSEVRTGKCMVTLARVIAIVEVEVKAGIKEMGSGGQVRK